ncbi:TfoX/Sxy family protein [Pseudolactococcus yaeyamensis]
MNISQMKNLGVISEAKLNQVGLMDSDDLIHVGTEKAFLQVRNLVDDGACLNFLLALEGAIQNIPKKEITSERKTALQECVQRNKK